MFPSYLPFIQKSVLHPEIDFTASEELVDDGILDSLTIVSVIGTLSMEYGIEIPYTVFHPRISRD